MNIFILYCLWVSVTITLSIKDENLNLRTKRSLFKLNPNRNKTKAHLFWKSPFEALNRSENPKGNRSTRFRLEADKVRWTTRRIDNKDKIPSASFEDVKTKAQEVYTYRYRTLTPGRVPYEDLKSKRNIFGNLVTSIGGRLTTWTPFTCWVRIYRKKRKIKISERDRGREFRTIDRVGEVTTRDRDCGVTTRYRIGGVTTRYRGGGVTTRYGGDGVTTRDRGGGITPRDRGGGFTPRYRFSGIIPRDRGGGVTLRYRGDESTTRYGGGRFIMKFGGFIVCCCVCAYCRSLCKRQHREQAMDHSRGDDGIGSTSVTTVNSYPNNSSYPPQPNA